MALPATPAFSKKLRLKIIARRIIIVPKIYLLDSCGKANLENLFLLNLPFYFFSFFSLLLRNPPTPAPDTFFTPNLLSQISGTPQSPAVGAREAGGWWVGGVHHGGF